MRRAIAVPAPRTGRATTRVNWLARQLKDAPPVLCIEAVAAWQRGKGPVKTLAAVRAGPAVLDAIDKFYADVVQHIKPWTPAPPKAKEDEATAPDEPAAQDDAPAVEAGMPLDEAGGAQPGPKAPASRSQQGAWWLHFRNRMP